MPTATFSSDDPRRLLEVRQICLESIRDPGILSVRRRKPFPRPALPDTCRRKGIVLESAWQQKHGWRLAVSSPLGPCRDRASSNLRVSRPPVSDLPISSACEYGVPASPGFSGARAESQLQPADSERTGLPCFCFGHLCSRTNSTASRPPLAKTPTTTTRAAAQTALAAPLADRNPFRVRPCFLCYFATRSRWSPIPEFQGPSTFTASCPGRQIRITRDAIQWCRFKKGKSGMPRDHARATEIQSTGLAYLGDSGDKQFCQSGH
ncbi:hypothetical protein B0T11DRAFT_268706 [Plectosphaerella cucumerina]|uniref:Uncharacterized protein n=1 Tax=Plectosphaerella cucumerina TaxID=40658 RepID=A0A8K0TRT7_9PEZI|nr:hypothetical protein B0T11DRAFT_268706 [Plectosphaerella cucumerina]